MTLSYTRFFKWAIPDFLTSPWHADWEALVRAMDRSLYGALLVINATEWANSTVYAQGDIVLSPDDGTLWVCNVAHTSAVTPTTFAADRVTNPTFWTSLTPITDADVAAAISAMGNAAIYSAQAQGAASQAMSSARAAKAAIMSLNPLAANVAGQASMAAMSRRRAAISAAAAAASAAAIDDVSIALKAQVFN